MTATAQRFTALDVFRGMTVCFMIIVNTPGCYSAVFAPLNHAQWNGFTPTDLVFPSFLFAVGNALSFVLNKWQNMPVGNVLTKIFRRTAIIFLIGLFLNYWMGLHIKPSDHFAFPSLSETRILGVLPRIALTYLAASLVVYFLKPRAALIISASILVLYWPILVLAGTGSDPLSPHTNAVLRLDTLIMGLNHLYVGEGFPFDPEGILSTFPAIVSVLAGFIAGRFIQKSGKTWEGLSKLLMAGALSLSLGLLWNYGFPINKKLWTSSFVLVSAGFDCLLLGIIIYWIDFRKKKTLVYFFEVFGRNPLFIYIISILGIVILYIIPAGGKTLYNWSYDNLFAWSGAYLGSMLFAIVYMFLCWLTGYMLDRRNIYIRV